MDREIFWVLALVVIGVFHRSAESSRITDNLESSGQESDDWLLQAMKDAKVLQKRSYYDDDYYGAEEIEIPAEFKKLKPPHFEDEDFEGLRQKSIIRVWSKDQTLDNEKQCLGVLVQWKTVVTPCSCVSHQNREKKITPTDHRVDRKKLTPIHGSEIYLLPLDKPTKAVRGDTTVLHPRCDNQFEVDIAAVITVYNIPEAKLVWVHTAENILFENNMVRAVAAQAVTGKCTVPVITTVPSSETNPEAYNSVEFLPIFYQHWDGCRQNVCPDYKGQKPTYQRRERCENRCNGTRFCLGWKGPTGLCRLLPGTPVFCDVGEIQGFMGFIVNHTYSCPLFQQNQAVMQGFNDALSWIRYILELGTYPNYELFIADWMKNFRKVHLPKAKIVQPQQKIALPNKFDFEKFRGSQSEAIVIVYWKQVFKCYGTLVSYLTVIVPCSCVSTSSKKVTDEKWFKEHVKVDVLDIRKFLVLGWANYIRREIRRYVKVKDIRLHEKCDNHYFFDYAMLELEEQVKFARIAWVMTTEKDIFTRILVNLPPADMIYGNCYYVEGELRTHIGANAPHIVPQIRRIQFENWNSCLKTVCSETILKSWSSEEFQKGFIEERCLAATIGDPRESPKNINGTRYCISADPYDGLDAWPLCNKPSGTPIFCDVEEARGFVGFLGGAWTNCPKDGDVYERDRAVFFGIDQYIEAFKEKTLLYILKGIIKKRKRSSANPLSLTVHPLIILLLTIIGLFL